MTKIKIISNDSYKTSLENVDKTLFAGILEGIHIPRNKIKEFIFDAQILMLASESVMPFDKELFDSAPELRFVSLDTTDFS